MKNLFQFLAEAGTSRASEQASKLNLKSDGHGGWLDSRGNFVAKTEGGRLVFTKKKGPKAPEGPVQQMAKRRADDDLAGAPLQRKPDPKRAAKAQEEPKTAKKGKEDEQSGEKEISDALTLAFGRFNPPTSGHEKLFKYAEKKAAGGDLKIYPSRTQDNKKNPLDVDMKISYMKKMFPDFEEEIINDSEMKSIFNVLIAADEEGYKNVNIVVGSDRLAEFESLSQKYNGDLYDFEEIKVISAGERTDSDDDSDTEGSDVAGMKSSKLRKAVMDDDFDKFKKGMPEKFSDADAQALFDAVRTGMKQKKKVKEEYDLWEIAPKQDPRSVRENYMLGKIFNLGEIVESLNTGLIGKVIRKGTNYLICVTEEDNMFKSWIHDVMETKDKKVKQSTETGIYGVPAQDREIGTKSHLRYAQSMVPGQGELKNFNIREFINRHKVKS